MKIKGLRWWIIGLVCLATIINYIDRSALGIMWPEMKKDLGLTEEDYAWIINIFTITYIAARAAKKEDPFEVWGSGKQGRDFVHIEDVMDCTLLAMDHITDGSAINIGQGRLTSFLEIIELFTKFAGYEPTIKPLLDKPVGVHSRYCNMDYVKERLGWEPKISIEEGMRRVYNAAVEKYA